ncbi:TRI16 protein, partial [Polypterus senegalus]
MEGSAGTSRSNARPVDVACDVCSGRKRKASKTCLTCMISYCELHLQEHKGSGAYKRHKLQEPVRGFKERICSKHNKILEMYCRTDKICVCSMCAATEHNGHDTRILSEEMSERKKFPSLNVPAEDSSEVPDAGHFLPRTLRTNLSNLKRNLEEISSWEFVKSSESGVWDVLGDPVMGDKAVPLITRAGDSHSPLLLSLFRDCCPLILDINTANEWLTLSERNKKVTDKRVVTRYPDHPDRFDMWPQVLCSRALRGGRFYWEVEWSGEKVEIGVTYKGIRRKGNSNECVLGYNDKSWSLYLSQSSCLAWHNKKKIEITAPHIHRIGIYLDCPGGSLSFYSVSDTLTLLHRFNASFTEPLYAGFKIANHCSLTICPLKRSGN